LAVKLKLARSGIPNLPFLMLVKNLAKLVEFSDEQPELLKLLNEIPS